MLLITERYGKCDECNNETILGDGLCAKCWDRQTELYQSLFRLEKGVTVISTSELLADDIDRETRIDNDKEHRTAWLKKLNTQ